MSLSMKIVCLSRSEKPIRHKLLLLAATFAILSLTIMGAATPAAAQAVDLENVKKLPHFTGLSDADFLAKSAPYSETPGGDKALSYTLRLPVGWHRADTEKGEDAMTVADVGHNVLGKVARFYGANGFGVQSRIELDSLRLDYDITVKNWFLNYIVSNGYTLEGLEQVNPGRMEALYVLVDGDQSYIVRTIAQLNGARIGLLSYYLPEEHFKEDRALQEKTVDSFQFTSPDAAVPEAVHTFAFLDLLRFDYPASWEIDQPDTEVPMDMSVNLIDTKDPKKLEGQITIRALAADGPIPLTQPVQQMKGSLAKIGISTGALVNVPTDYKFKPQVFFSRVEVYAAKGDSNQYAPQEFWLAVMKENRFYYIVSMLSPSRNSNFLTWARNTEAFRTVLESLRP